VINGLRSIGEMIAIYWRHSKVKCLLAVGLPLLGGLAGPLLALALRAATDAALARDVWGATVAGALTGAAAIGLLTLRHFNFVPMAENGEAAVITLETELLQLANGSPRIEHHEQAEYADRISVLQRELAGLIDGMGSLLTIVSAASSLVITAVLLAFVNPWLLLLPLAGLPPTLTATRASNLLERAKLRSASVRRQSAHLFALATGAASAKELRVFRLQNELRQRHKDLWAAEDRVMARAQLRATLITASGQLVFAAAYVIALLLVVRQAIAGRSRVGDVVLVVTLAAQVNQQVTSVLSQLGTMQRVCFGFTRLRWLRALVRNQEQPTTDSKMPARIERAIELRDVAFTYPGTDRPVLSDVNLRLPAGSTVAIVGENGAGKTTLVKLLCRFYEPTGGTISVDGIDLRRVPMEAWRERIAAGFQDFVRLEALAQWTVGIGDVPRIDDERAVRGALDRARSTDVIDRLENGLATQLGKSYSEGVELSGGQWQKLALGRAMMRETPLLLILDEPTSALDAEAEHRLFEKYSDNARRVGAAVGAITVLVSHRFSTVRMADLIVVVDEGRIVEAGSHDALMEKDGVYAELFTLHAAAYR
jgi:ATP-binding cassette subfamily B protein